MSPPRPARPLRRPILVAGAGIGGLAAAIGLARKRFEVLVLDKAHRLGEVGAGIQLGPNAFHAFEALGIGEAARALSVFIDHLRLMDAVTAEEITRIELGEAFRARFGNPYAVVHRGELHRVLLDACRGHPRVTLRTSAETVGYVHEEDGVRVRLADGETIGGALLIGADGLWSKVRNQMLGDGAPRVSGHSTYRALLPFEVMPEALRWNAATLWAGPKCHIVHYPLMGWKAFNLVVTYHNHAPEPVAGKAVTHDEVRRGFEHVHPRARQLIDLGTDWKLWVLCDRDPVERWVDGRVALLGDAAHPMLQYFAQGACMALEDAVALSEALGDGSLSIEAALERYRARRVLRTARVQLSSREIGDHIYHPAGAHAQLRNAIMKAKTSQDYNDHLAWLYGGGETAGVAAEMEAFA